MPDVSTTFPALRVVLLVLVPASYVLAAATARWSRRWQSASWLGGAAMAVACVALACQAIDGSAHETGPVLIPFDASAALRLSVRSDGAGALVQLLVSFIGWVIVRYSRNYLSGEPGQVRYVRALMATLAAVSVVLVTDNLAVLAIAWLATSLALHRLLTFYRDRPQAQLAAHKKFIASRLGDLCLATAIVLIGHALGTLEISDVISRVQTLHRLPDSLQTAALLLVLTALLKCAQLPVHGWLIQVMEAPTPVSALLHAGVVNLGGFLMIRFAGFVGLVPSAQTLLVIAGSVTAVVASLVMMTRISIKVMLAWSTCAQMGFMLLECGLGLYDMALLHLVAHSLYKAHAFLSTGGAVEQARLTQLAPRPARTPLSSTAVAAIVGLALFGVVAFGLCDGFRTAPALWITASTVALALPSLLLSPVSTSRRWRIAAVIGAFGVVLAFFAWHALFTAWMTSPDSASTAFRIVWVQISFITLFVLQSAIRARPDGGIGQRLYPWFYAGLYLDELFTRLTFRVWPARPFDAKRS